MEGVLIVRAQHIVALLATLVLVALGGSTINCAQLGSMLADSKATKVPGPRFEVTAHGQSCVDLKQFPNYTPEDNANCMLGHSSIWGIDVMHDKVSGAEFICASQDRALSCFTTGRNWK